MKNIIKNFTISKLNDTKYIKPIRLDYELNGIKKQWEAVEGYDSVAILLYHRQKDAFVLVKQFRAPIYFNNKQIKFTYELCAGIVDKNISLEEIAKEEIDEECGYKVQIASIKKITSFYTNVGISGNKQTLFYCEVDESMKVHKGGGINDEDIELHFIKVSQMNEFLLDESKSKTSGLMFAFYWFEKNKDKLFAN